VPKLTNDPFALQVRDMIQLPVGDWKKGNAENIFGVLFGSAVALMYCFDLRFDYLVRQKGTTWKSETILPSLDTAMSEYAFNWHADANLTAWSYGFFLNKAETNIRVAFERTITGWLLTHSDAPSSPSAVLELAKSDLGSRIGSLMKLSGASARARLAELQIGLSHCNESVAAAAEVSSLAESWVATGKCDLESALEIVRASQLTDDQCLALISMRSAAFLLDPAGLLRRPEGALIIETALAINALRSASSIWRSMISDAR
jgi:hypothetical protein